MEAVDEAQIELTSYLWTPTVNRKWSDGVEAVVTSTAAAWITAFPADYPDSDQAAALMDQPFSGSVDTAFSPWRLITRRAGLPLWVVGTAVGGGLLLLLLIVLILYKLGFFKRRTKEDYQAMTHT